MILHPLNKGCVVHIDRSSFIATVCRGSTDCHHSKSRQIKWQLKKFLLSNRVDCCLCPRIKIDYRYISLFITTNARWVVQIFLQILAVGRFKPVCLIWFCLILMLNTEIHFKFKNVTLTYGIYQGIANSVLTLTECRSCILTTKIFITSSADV